MRKFFILVVCALAPLGAVAAVGIPSGVLWCNKTNIVAGDKVTCSTVVVNPEAVEARGSVDFLANGKMVESKLVFVPAGSYKNVDFSFVAQEGKQEYLARIAEGKFTDQLGTPIPQGQVKVPLVTSALKLAVGAKPPEPVLVVASSTTASTSSSTLVTEATTPLNPKNVETKIHDVLPEAVASHVAKVSVPVVKNLEEFRLSQDASNQARINGLMRDLAPKATTSTTTKPGKDVLATTTATSSAPLSPWGLVKERIFSGKAFTSSPWAHLVLLLSLVWDLVVHHWWVFYVALAYISYDIFAFLRNKWRERSM